MRPSPRILILGAGMSGMCMGIRLRQSGIDSFTILEKTDRVGGTWRDNIYPGVACDVPSHLYSYSFELNPSWSRVYSPGWEIQQYCEHCVDKYGLGPNLRFGAQVEHVEYTGEDWCVQLEGGEQLRADFVVSGLGGLVHLDARSDTSERFNSDLQRDLDRTIWKSGCKSWYMDEAGKVFALWPHSTLRYLWEMRRPVIEEYDQLEPTRSG